MRCHEIEQPLGQIVVETESLERKPWTPAPLAAAQLVVERMAAGFEHRPHAHDVRAATEHHHTVDRVADASRRPQDRKQFALGPLRAVVRQEPVGLIDDR